MKRLSPEICRILAIDPTTCGFGFVVLEGQMSLVDWGVKRAKRDKNAKCLAKVLDLIRQYQPTVIVFEDCSGRESRRHERIKEFLEEVKNLATNNKIKTRKVSRHTLKKTFASERASSRYEIATVIAKRLPDLAPLLPPRRQPWMSEDARMHIFNAAAMVLALISPATASQQMAN